MVRFCNFMAWLPALALLGLLLYNLLSEAPEATLVLVGFVVIFFAWPWFWWVVADKIERKDK